MSCPAAGPKSGASSAVSLFPDPPRPDCGLTQTWSCAMNNRAGDWRDTEGKSPDLCAPDGACRLGFFYCALGQRRWDREGTNSQLSMRDIVLGGGNMAVAEESWTKKFMGEVLGVFVLVFLGDSFVAYAVSGGKNGFLAGLLAAGFFWGFAVTLAIYACGAVSGAQPNPAVTLALAWRRGFPWSKVPGYIGAQVVGAFLAAIGVSFVWNWIIVAYENANRVVRGDTIGVTSGLIFWANWPHPGLVGYKGDYLTQDPWW